MYYNNKSNLKIEKSNVILLFVVIVLAVLVLLGVIQIPCMIREVTGLYCPGCGATRAVISLLKGQWYQAIRYNAIIFIDIPAIAIICFLDYRFKGDKKVAKITQALAIFLLIITIVFFVLRNLPAFSYLAPTIIS